MYDSPKSLQGGEDYDVPRAHLVIKGFEVPSNRSSAVSMLSTGSSSMSQRSSLDTSGHDIYDVPPAPKVVIPLNRSANTSQADLCDIYDTPPKARVIGGSEYRTPSKENSYSEINNMCKEPSYQEISDIPLKLENSTKDPDAREYIDDYAVPRSDFSRGSGDSGIVASKLGYETLSSATKCDPSNDIYDVPPSQALPVKDSKSMSSSLVEESPEAGFQRLQVSDTGAVYDVPPQVSRDMNSMRPDSVEWDQDEPEPYEPLRLEAECALEVLARLQQDVHASASRLLSFVGKQWRSRELLQPKLYSIKLACMSVKTSLQEYLEFGQGALATAQNVLPPDERQLTKDMSALLDPLLDAQTQIRKRLKDLEETQWLAERLARVEDGPGHQEDDLDIIIRTAKSVPLNARSLTLLIQGNAKRLFRSASAEMSPSRRISTASVEAPKQHSDSTVSPPTRDVQDGGSPQKKPPPLRPKPKMPASSERTPSMRDRPLPLPPKDSPDDKVSSSEAIYNEISDKAALEHYDYVHLSKDSKKGSKESLDEVDSLSRALSSGDLLSPSRARTSGLSPVFRERLEKLQQDAEKPVQIHTESSIYDTACQNASPAPARTKLHENDLLILNFYASEVSTHIEVLLNAIDAFMKCVDYNQPPKVFIAHSKYVILAAHKLVYIGDTISRNLLNEELRHEVAAKGIVLCDALKGTVVGTKNAALNYPSVSFTQEMVDRVVDVSHAANALRQVITSATKH